MWVSEIQTTVGKHVWMSDLLPLEDVLKPKN